MERSVAPLTGSVDRNPSTYGGLYDESEVAPLTGSVDRNTKEAYLIHYDNVAPLTGSVDRNIDPLDVVRAGGRRSPHGERG